MEDSVVRHADDDTFETVLKSDRPTLVDFWAPWCSPCRAIAPVLEELAQSYGAKINIVKVNVDASPETARRYAVRGIPTLLFINAGEVRGTQVGLVPKDRLRALIDKHLSEA